MAEEKARQSGDLDRAESSAQTLPEPVLATPATPKPTLPAAVYIA